MKGWRELKNGIQLNDNGQGIVSLFNSGFYMNGKSIEGAVQLAAVAPVTGKEDNGLEYVDFQFRMLSASYIPNADLDFSEPGVLKSAVKMFATKIYRNHRTTIEDSVGLTRNPEFDESSKIPGVNSTYRFYKKFAEDIIDRLNVNVIDSTSVGVRFTWRKSHPDMEFGTFVDMLGDKVNGEIVRLIVTKILSVPEASIVWSGADSNAKRLSENSGNQNQFNHEEIINHGEENMGKIEELESELGSTKASLKTVSAEKEDYKTKFENLEKEKIANAPLVEAGKAQEKSLREDAEKFYRLAYEKPKDEMLKILQSGDVETVKIMGADFKERAEKLHPAKCPNCKSALTRQSSKTDDLSDKPDIKIKTENYG
jgi:hypothetical protein